MINIRKQGDRVTAYLTEFVVDTVAEVDELPVFPNTARGSVCFCIENGAIYILGGDDKWTAMKSDEEKASQLFGNSYLLLAGAYQDSYAGIIE